jgi:hypothetical protein
VAASFEAMLLDGLVDAVIVASPTELAAHVRRGAVGWIEMISFFGKDPEPPHSDFATQTLSRRTTFGFDQGIEVHGSEGMLRTEIHATSSASRDRRPSSCASTLPRWLTRVCLQDLHWLSMNNEWPANAFAVIWSPIAKTQSE